MRTQTQKKITLFTDPEFASWLSSLPVNICVVKEHLAILFYLRLNADLISIAVVLAPDSPQNGSTFSDC